MGMLVSIYRSDYDSDLNVFKGKNQLVVVNCEGPFQPDDDSPAAKLLSHGYGKGHYLVPDDDDFEGVQMHGGTFASTFDSRWSEIVGYGAVAIYDRRESYDLAKKLSR